MEYLINLVYAILVGAGIFFIAQSLNDYKKSGVEVLFIYFLNALILLALIRLFFALSDFGILKIEEATIVFFWHIMFYIAIAVFLVAARNIAKLVGQTTTNDSNGKALITFLITVPVSLLFILIAMPSNEFLVNNFEGNFLDRLGVLHIIAFVFAALVTGYLLTVYRKFEGNVRSVALPLLLVVGILSLIHFWELLTESWKVINLEGEIIEVVEMFLWIPVYFFIAYAFWRFRKKTKAEIV